ncbi:MAG: hypothetical protein IOD12_12365 [Silvanigrellales bacterium]|nr:hypothetical protein [Silvanigrellales bacterium]
MATFRRFKNWGLGTFVFFSCVALAQTPSPLSPLLNRSLLSVGTDVYTAWDASALACAWSAVGSVEAFPEFNWLASSILAPNGQNRTLDTDSLPPEARRFLFQALVWNESRKLNLFVPQEREVELAIPVFRASVKSGKCRIPGGGPAATAFLTSLPESRVRTLVDIALRAQAFERVRGDLRKNPNLLSQTWFWHATMESEAK